MEILKGTSENSVVYLLVELGDNYAPLLGMKTDRIRTDITDIVFVFIFMSGFGFEYG
jgi:hypothetical protein